MVKCFIERSVRPELVEGQSRTISDEAIMRLEYCGYMLRQAQHERFSGRLSPTNRWNLRAFGQTSFNHIRLLPMRQE